MLLNESEQEDILCYDEAGSHRDGLLQFLYFLFFLTFKKKKKQWKLSFKYLFFVYCYYVI